MSSVQRRRRRVHNGYVHTIVSGSGSGSPDMLLVYMCGGAHEVCMDMTGCGSGVTGPDVLLVYMCTHTPCDGTRGLVFLCVSAVAAPAGIQDVHITTTGGGSRRMATHVPGVYVPLSPRHGRGRVEFLYVSATTAVEFYRM